MADNLINKNSGIKAENYFASLLNANGVKYTYEDSWFDFLVNNTEKVEVKSCQLFWGCKSPTRRGRFDFRLKGNRQRAYKENCWVAFIIRHRDIFLLLGLCRAKELEGRRFGSFTQLAKIKMLGFDEWLKEILK
jgi:hypothetical protein